MRAREPFIRFEAPETDADGLVSAILDAHVQHEGVRRLRRSLLYVLAALGGAMALTSATPSLAPVWLATNLPLAWALCCAAAVAAGLREFLWSWRRSRLLAAVDVSPEEGS